MSRLTNLANNRYTLLTVVDLAPKVEGRIMWNCVCDCGKKIAVRADNLTGGKTTSCGHIRNQVAPRITAADRPEPEIPAPKIKLVSYNGDVAKFPASGRNVFGFAVAYLLESEAADSRIAITEPMFRHSPPKCDVGEQTARMLNMLHTLGHIPEKGARRGYRAWADESGVTCVMEPLPADPGGARKVHAVVAAPPTSESGIVY